MQKILEMWHSIPAEIRVLILIEAWNEVGALLASWERAANKTESKIDDYAVGAVRRLYRLASNVAKKRGKSNGK